MSSKATASEPASQAPQLPTAKLKAVARFKSFTGSLVTSRSKRPKISFPPPSWDVEDFKPSSTTSSTPSSTLSPTVQDPAQTSQSAPQPVTNEDLPQAEANAAEAPVEPVTFARKLQALLELLPIPGMSSQATTPAVETSSAATSKTEPSSPPVPPDLDPGLVKMLSSEDVMNGESGTDGKDKGRPSIWNILAGLRKDDKNAKGDSSGKNVGSSVEEEAGGVMMYAPLEPKADSQVCLAESEPVIETPPTPTPATGTTTTPAPEPEEKRVWVPSTTELSVLTTWWGYRLYLPPPVMQKLGSSSVQTAARAAMVTGALKWMVDKIPTLLVPPQLRPALKMLKTLAPLAGYVGVFVAWSWDRIRALDEGVYFPLCHFSVPSLIKVG